MNPETKYWHVRLVSPKKSILAASFLGTIRLFNDAKLITAQSRESDPEVLSKTRVQTKIHVDVYLDYTTAHMPQYMTLTGYPGLR